MLKARSLWVGIGGLILYFLIVLGATPEETLAFRQYGHAYGPFVLVLIAFTAAYEAFRGGVRDDREKASADLYSTDRQARLARAYYYVYHVYRRGEKLKAATPEVRREWDKDVVMTLGRYHPNMIWTYHSWTHRDPGNPAPLAEEHFEAALDTLRQWLDKNFYGTDI